MYVFLEFSIETMFFRMKEMDISTHIFQLKKKYLWELWNF